MLIQDHTASLPMSDSALQRCHTYTLPMTSYDKAALDSTISASTTFTQRKPYYPTKDDDSDDGASYGTPFSMSS